MSGWISVKKELPNFYKPVLTLHANVVQHVLWKRDDIENDDWRWIPAVPLDENDVDHAEKTVFSHWQPLPEPPQQKEIIW